MGGRRRRRPQSHLVGNRPRRRAPRPVAPPVENPFLRRRGLWLVVHRRHQEPLTPMVRYENLWESRKGPPIPTQKLGALGHFYYPRRPDVIESRKVLSQIVIAALEHRILLAGADAAAGRFTVLVEQ